MRDCGSRAATGSRGCRSAARVRGDHMRRSLNAAHLSAFRSRRRPPTACSVRNPKSTPSRDAAACLGGRAHQRCGDRRRDEVPVRADERGRGAEVARAPGPRCSLGRSPRMESEDGATISGGNISRDRFAALLGRSRASGHPLTHPLERLSDLPALRRSLPARSEAGNSTVGRFVSYA